MKGYGCSVSQCLILHIIKGKAPGDPCMTDWGHTNQVQYNKLHRSDQSPLTGQTGLTRGRARFLLQDSSIAPRKKRGSEACC